MEIMLFMMFFTSPPASKADPVWTLQSTAQFQFATMEGCKKYGQHLQDRLDTTDTVKMRGWCVNQGSGFSTFALPLDCSKPAAGDAQSNSQPATRPECQPLTAGKSEEIVPNLNVKRRGKGS